jgi:hypothetical protein
MKPITILIFGLLLMLSIQFLLLEFYILSMLFSGMGIFQVIFLEWNK